MQETYWGFKALIPTNEQLTPQPFLNRVP